MLLFISIKAIYIIKFSIYLCPKFICVLGLHFASLIQIIA
jgi:hypothetical protein